MMHAYPAFCFHRSVVSPLLACIADRSRWFGIAERTLSFSSCSTFGQEEAKSGGR